MLLLLTACFIFCFLLHFPPFQTGFWAAQIYGSRAMESVVRFLFWFRFREC